MKLFFIFPWPRQKSKVNHPEQIASGGCWSLIHSFRLLGHEVYPINLYDEKDQINENDARVAYQFLLDQINPDFVLVFDTGRAKIPWKAIADAKNLKNPIKFVYHAGDDPMRHDANIEAIRKGNFDIVFAAQRPFLKAYRDCLPHIFVDWIPYHHDGLLHYPEPTQERYDIVHIGKIYGLRQKLLKGFSDNGISLNIGNGFGHLYRAGIASARIGWHQAWCGEVGYRHFEWPAMGKMLLCDELEPEYGLGELLPVGSYVTYNGKNEEEKVADAIEKVKYYKEHESERKSIAIKGCEHAIKYHGPLNRAEAMITFMAKVS